MISIFPVLFKLSNSVGLPVRITSYVKIPYTANRLNVFLDNYYPYNNLSNTMYYVKRGYYVTYFYPKNNIINYYKKSDSESIIPVYDFEHNTCHIFKSRADKYSITGENSLLIKTEDGKYYVVNKDKNLVIFNESDSKTLYELDVSDKLYCEYFNPIANVVVPVLYVTKNGIGVALCNLANDEVRTISWELEHINKLINVIMAADIAYYRIKGDDNVKLKHIKRISNRILGIDDGSSIIGKIVDKLTNINKEYDSIIEGAKYEAERVGLKPFKRIEKFVVRDIYYMYDTNEYRVSYLKGIRVEVDIIEFKSLVLNIKIELRGRRIICCLDLENGKFEKVHDHYIYCNRLFKDYEFLVEKYELERTIMNNYLSNFMFENDCYYVRSDSCGLTYMKKGEYYEDVCKLSAIYPYKNYWIIINNRRSSRRRKLAIIDTKRNLMSVWAVPREVNESQYCINFYTLFHYYITNQDKLIFISIHLDCISIIDGAEIEQFFNTKELSECKNEEYRNIIEIVKCYNVDDLAKQAISKKHEVVNSLSDIKAITHYMDKKSDNLYIIARYKIDKEIYIGLFVLEISENNVKLSLLYDKIEKGYHKNKFENKASYIRAIEKMDFYGLQEGDIDDTKKMMNLDLMYRYGYISSIKYNRRSLTFRALYRQYFDYNIKCANKKVHYTPYKLIVIDYQCEDRDKIISDNSFLLLLTELSVVRKMHVIKV